MRDTDLAWFAGWVEGEGWFRCDVGPSRAHFQIAASSTDEDVVRRAQQIVGGSMSGPHKSSTGIKPYWQWSISNRPGCVRLARAILPFMGVRRSEALARMLEVDRVRPVRNFRPSAVEPAHGTSSRYHSRIWKCRCDPCRKANTAHARNLKAEAVLAREGAHGFLDLSPPA